MNNDSQLLLGKDIGFWLKVLLLLLAAAVMVYLVATTVLVKINYTFTDQAQPGEVEMMVVGSSGAESQPPSFAGFMFVPRDTKQIVVRSGSYETRAIIKDFPLVGISEYNLRLESQRKVSKIAGNTLGCNLTNKHGTFTHTCGSLNKMSQVLRPNDNPWVNKITADPATSIFARYQDGFLGFQYGSPQLQYIIPGGNTSSVSIPDDLVSSPSDNIFVITNTSDSKDGGFVLANTSTGNFIYKAGIKSDEEIKQFSRNSDINTEFNLTICAMNAKLLVCYYGPGDRDHADHNYRQRNNISYIEVIDLADPSKKHVYKAGAELGGVSRLIVSASGKVYAISGTDLYQLRLEGDSIKPAFIYPGITTAYASGSSLYITVGRNLVQYLEDDDAAYLRFGSDNILDPDLSVYGESVILNAFVNAPTASAMRGYSHAYLLTNNPQPADQPRKEDFLPYHDDSTIQFMDYDDSRVFISLRPILSSDSNGNLTVDTGKTKEKRDSLINRLKNDRLVNDQTQFIFY